MLAKARHQSTGFVLVALPLIALAWATLWLWALSPYGRYLDHGGWTEIGFAASICSALPAGEVLLPGLLYVGGWVLMTAAMMLPTTMPLLEIVARIGANRPDGRLLLGLVIAGYLGVWSLFGLVAHLADLGLHALVPQSPWLTFNGWVLGVGTLALAGLFQFSGLKRRCLDACRTPMAFVVQHWRGRNQRRQALLLGVHHGFYCVGCCWALMLLMFVVGTGSVGWMLALGVVMAAEKNLSWGRRLSAPLGIGLLVWSAWIVLAEAHLIST
jgi:predicted metal-binding membrane protein